MPIVLRPQGKLDLAGSATLQQQIEKAANLSVKQESIWIIDLEKVNFINHFGLTTLVMARRQALNRGGKLFLRNINSPVQLMLDIAELTPDFDRWENYQAADQNQTENSDVSSDQTSLDAELNLDQLTDSQAESIQNLQQILANFKSRFPQKD